MARWPIDKNDLSVQFCEGGGRVHVGCKPESFTVEGGEDLKSYKRGVGAILCPEQTEHQAFQWRTTAVGESPSSKASILPFLQFQV
jgi:hypothetical protein